MPWLYSRPSKPARTVGDESMADIATNSDESNAAPRKQSIEDVRRADGTFIK